MLRAYRRVMDATPALLRGAALEAYNRKERKLSEQCAALGLRTFDLEDFEIFEPSAHGMRGPASVRRKRSAAKLAVDREIRARVHGETGK